MVKSSDFAECPSTLKDQCRDLCLNNCSCVTYAFDVCIGCMTLSCNLIDIQKMSNGGANLYIRLAQSELDRKDYSEVIIIVVVIVGMIIGIICTFSVWKWLRKHKGNIGRQTENSGEKAIKSI
ncbi:hypothetical protein Ddye_019517 [Dipteronia dyeriana]|uniref:Apple domain-containing protein n=1 Tax=Dipteronia dyeriana TaxID=168575 RepID=A0AAD9TYH2_9ROSI|nr:hypothetical protein Ddye_019517 [Dipteronia dyeriana]